MKNHRQLVPGERVRVYRNLHKNKLSVQDKTGRVVAHLVGVLLQDVEFVVRKAGHAKVLKTRKKNVHAFAYGTFLYAAHTNDFGNYYSKVDSYIPVRYNPFSGPHFFHDQTIIEKAKFVAIQADGKIYAQKEKDNQY